MDPMKQKFYIRSLVQCMLLTVKFPQPPLEYPLVIKENEFFFQRNY